MNNNFINLNSENLINKFNDFCNNNKNSLAEIVAEYLKINNTTLSVAESLTGGMIASKLVDISGISNNFYEGIVAYSNYAKNLRLKVKTETLEKYGPVSSQTAAEMARGLIYNNVDLSVSTTGIAGPTGDTPTKPVGLVYFGLASKDKTYCVKQIFKGNRTKIRELSTDFALYLLILYLSNKISI